MCRFMTMDVCIFFQGGRCVCNLLPKEEALECRLLLECMYSRVVLFKVLLGDSTLRRYDEESSDPLADFLKFVAKRDDGIAKPCRLL